MQSTSCVNARLDAAQTGIKIAGRNINNLRYAGNTTLFTESEELKSLLMKVKEQNEEVSLKLNMVGILSPALPQHHLLGFEIAPLEFLHLHQLCS